MVLDIFTVTGEPSAKMELPDAVFGQKPRKDLLWETINVYLARQRQGTAKTKTRAEVSGGGKKPWRQKHTGRARHGSTRSPIWRHGGVVFGPLPRDYDLKVPAQKRAMALSVALSALAAENRIRLIEDFELAQAKTRELAKVVRLLGLDQDKVLMVVGSYDSKLVRAARNMKLLDLMRAQDLNAYQVLAHDLVVLTRRAAEYLAARKPE